MKLVAIYSVWSDYDLLKLSIKNISPLVDQIIVMTSEHSNYGEYSPMPVPLSDDPKVLAYPNIPQNNLSVMDNERRKRNQGIEIAKQLGFTHFLICDSDEFYEPTAFLKDKEKFLNPNLAGLVARTRVYFRLPTLTIGIETTLVPFIHKLTPSIQCEFNRKYPFAWIDGKIRIDPTRSLNINSGVEMSDTTMHHFSWVRSDIQRKIRNSTARQNIEKSTIIRDYTDAKPGYYCEFYTSKIESCENLFNIPEILDHELIRLHEQQVKEEKPSSSGSDTGPKGLL